MEMIKEKMKRCWETPWGRSFYYPKTEVKYLVQRHPWQRWDETQSCLTPEHKRLSTVLSCLFVYTVFSVKTYQNLFYLYWGIPKFKIYVSTWHDLIGSQCHTDCKCNLPYSRTINLKKTLTITFKNTCDIFLHSDEKTIRHYQEGGKDDLVSLENKFNQEKSHLLLPFPLYISILFI